MSNESVPEHMVNRKPPPSTKSRICQATLRFITLTLLKPNVRAIPSCRATSSWYHAALRYER